MKQLLVLALLALTPFAAQAAIFDYTYVEGGYVDSDNDDGLWLGGSFGFTPNVRAVAGFYSLDNSDITEIGVGYYTAVANKVDVYGDVKFIDISFGNFSDDGLGLTGGVRFAITPRFELGGGINYYSFDNSETNLFVRGAFDIAENLAVSLEVESGDRLDRMLLGVRFSF